nr:hypothetical protein [Tanacetum cinerariifolium]
MFVEEYTCFWKSAYVFLEGYSYVLTKFDEKVKRALMFVEEYTYVLGRVHMCFWM